jgi:hypothetical protein
VGLAFAADAFNGRAQAQLGHGWRAASSAPGIIDGGS